MKIGSEAKDKGKCEDEQVDFVYVAASPRGTITGGWCDASNAGKLGDVVCVPCGGDDGTTEATTTTTVTTKDTSGSVNMYGCYFLEIEDIAKVKKCLTEAKAEAKHCSLHDIRYYPSPSSTSRPLINASLVSTFQSMLTCAISVTSYSNVMH